MFEIIASSGLAATHRYIVYMITIGNSLEGRWWNPTQMQLASITGLAQSTVSRALRELVNMRWIIRSEVSSGGVETPCLRIHPSRIPTETSVQVAVRAASQAPPPPAAASPQRARRDRVDPPPAYLMPFEAMSQEQQRDILEAAARHARGEPPVGVKQIADLRTAFWYGKAERKGPR